MTTVFYPAVAEKAEDGYSLFFPGVPGCTSAGDTLEQVFKDAKEALSLHIEGMGAAGEVVPPPLTLDELRVDEDIEAAALLLIPVERPGKPALQRQAGRFDK